MKLRIGGVPEHFNFLWRLDATKEVFRNYGFYYEFIEYTGGTGAMTNALEKNEIDIALLLTEGAIAGIEAGKDLKIHFPFVLSPLLWGVFTGAHAIGNIMPYENAVFAISRFYSGSHLMAKFLAAKSGQELNESHFLVSNNLDGARQALAIGSAQYFLWEKYMTRYLVHSGEFKQIDEIAAPWPAFVVSSKKKFALNSWENIQSAISESTINFMSFPLQQRVNWITSAYSISEEDAVSWNNQVKYFNEFAYWKDQIYTAALIMKSSGMIEQIKLLQL